MLVVGAASGGADPGGQAATRDHGHGAWFRSVCDAALNDSAACQAQVVSDASGDPLAGGSPPSTALTPAQFHSGYNLPTTAPGGTSPTVAIVDAYDDPNAQADLNTFDTKWGLPSCTATGGCFTKINETGGTRLPSANGGWSLEISLDVQTVHSICQTCKILLVEANSANDSDLGQAENEAASWPGVVAISNSWGGNEFSGEHSLDTSYFTHAGIAITVSSGDSGYGVEWPAASPTVTAVGGTTLNLNSNGTYASESAWTGGGSGCSSQESKPSWQTDGASCSHRTVVDVAADADPNSGAAVYDSVSYQGQTGWFQVGGTSLASPLIAATYALAGANGTNVNAASTPYAYAASFGTGPTSAFHDVTTGSNANSCSPASLCTAGAGFDGPTGLGTPNGIGAFSAAPAGPPADDFSLSTSSQSTSLTSGTGGSTSYTVSTAVVTGSASIVGLSATGLPGGVTSSFVPTSVTAGGSSTLTLAVPASVPASTYSFQITGAASGGPSHTINASLVVQAGPKPDFTMTVTPSSQTIGGSGAASYTVTITPVNSLTTSVSLSLSGLPGRVTGSFSPASVSAAGGTSTLTVTARNAKRTNNARLTITAKSGSITHTAGVTLNVS